MKVTLAASAVFGYAWLVPAALYAVLWWMGGSTSENKASASSLSFLELLCVYGYSLAIYIPVSVLWTIQNSAFQWTLVLTGAGLSGAVLLLAIWPSVQDHAKKIGVILIVIVVVLHLLLACGFMLYFFHVPATSVASENVTSGNINSGVIKKDTLSDDNSKDFVGVNSDSKSAEKPASEKIPQEINVKTKDQRSASVEKKADAIK